MECSALTFWAAMGTGGRKRVGVEDAVSKTGHTKGTKKASKAGISKVGKHTKACIPKGILKKRGADESEDKASQPAMKRPSAAVDENQPDASGNSSADAGISQTNVA